MTPYEFGWMLKQAIDNDSIARMSAMADQVGPNGTGQFVGGHMVSRNGQNMPLSASQQGDVDAARQMSASFNNLNAGAGGLGRGGMQQPQGPATQPAAPAAMPAQRRPAAPAAPAAAATGGAADPMAAIRAQRVAQAKADAAKVRGASGTPGAMGNGANGTHQWSGQVMPGGAATGTYKPPVGGIK